MERKVQTGLGGVMNAKKVRSADKAAQEAAAEELQRQIDDILSGQAKPEPPRNLRDFVNEKMAKLDRARTGRSGRAAARSSSAKKKSK